MKKVLCLVLSIFIAVIFCSCQSENGAGGEDISIDYDYLDENGEIPKFEDVGFISPLSGKITSPYGMRVNPITKKESFHTGIDVGVKENTPVAVVADGKVVEAGESKAYGNYVLVVHENGLKTYYAHCNEITVKKDIVVRQGEIIAYSGNTGTYSTGPHLHFEVRSADTTVNPVKYIRVVDNEIKN